eukprot:CAMPEP_0180502244 /NCGR_PEP_ID=MMETSP1036_2-20121128/45312_1 /TAXON_ID=632150 /ORGANISM="Azadinium spinosum, Strain 3D9" /LENGTH=43 /DNA_ID= /DNA_START= /DNA_END= /DNA_ORIENTATION=
MFCAACGVYSRDKVRPCKEACQGGPLPAGSRALPESDPNMLPR